MSSLLTHGMKRREAQIGIRKLGEKQFSKAKMSIDQHQIMGILKQWMTPDRELCTIIMA